MEKLLSKKLEKAKVLENLIKGLKNNKKTIYLIRDYLDVISFLHYAGAVNYDETIEQSGIDLELFDKYELKEIKNTINEYVDNMDIIIDITNNLKDVYKEYPIIPISHSEKSYLDYNYGIELLESFFRGLGNDFYNIFRYTIIEKNFINLPNFHGGFNLDTSFTDKSSLIIVGHSKNDFHYFQTFAHEIGHSYENNLQSNKKVYFNYNTCEVVSTFIQRIFNYYLWNKSNLRDDALYHNMIRQVGVISHFETVEVGNDIFTRGDFNGAIVANYSLPWKNIAKKSKKEFTDKDLPQVCFNDYLYLLCDVIASNLVKLYINNPKEGLKALKDFITSDCTCTYRERLIGYGNVDGIRDAIKAAHQYQKRHYYL